MIITDKEYFERTAQEQLLQMREHAQKWNQERLDGRFAFGNLAKALIFRDYAKAMLKLARKSEANR